MDLQDGTAVVAFDLHTDEILGAFLNEDFQNTDPTGLEAFLENADGQWGPVMNIIAKLEDQLMSKYDIPADPSNRISGEFFHMWMIGVSPKSRGRNVGKNLFLCSCRLAKMRGFRLAFAECTGSISTHLFREYLGAEVQGFEDYSTYSGEGYDIINEIPKTGHLGTSLMTVDLTTSNKWL